MIRKATALVVCLLLILNAGILVFAAGSSLSVTATATELGAGERTTLTVKLTTVESVRSIGVKVTFDSDALTLVSAESLVTGAMVNKYDTTKNNLAAMLSSAAVYDGDVLSLCFEAKDSFSGTTTVELTPSMKVGTTQVACDGASLDLTIGDNKKVFLDTASLSLADTIDVNFYTILTNAVTADAGAYALFTGPNGEKQVLVSEAADSGDGRYIFTYPVYAKQTLEDITLRFFDGTNTQIDLFMNDTAHTAIGTDGYSYSVGEYLAGIGAGEESVPMKDLAAALADYGAAADILFGHSAENPPTVQTDLSAITADTTVSYKITDTGSKPTGFSLIGATLLLQNETTLRVYFTAEGTPAFSVTVDGKTATPVEKDGAYYVSIPGITAKELGAAHQICFGDYQINCSALTYAYSVLKNYPDSDTSEQAVKLRTLVRTLVRYNEAAVTYFESK